VKRNSTPDKSPGTLKKNYLVAEEDGGVVVFETTYEWTSQARFPKDAKPRELNSEYFWMTVINQSILPKASAWDKAHLPYSIIYT
jgi:hypothetical protein